MLSRTRLLLFRHYTPMGISRSVRCASSPASLVWMPRSKVGWFMGKDGSTIDGFAKKTNAKIAIDINEKFVRDDCFPVKIRGTAEQCNAAKEAIEQFKGELHMSIPKAILHISLFAEIEQSTGTFISIDTTDQDTDGNVPITIYCGTDQQRVAARDAIEQQFSVNIEIEIPWDKTGVIVGKEGTKQIEIEEMFGVRFDIDYSRCSGRNIPVRIVGTIDGCNAAKETIERLISTSSREEMEMWIKESDTDKIKDYAIGQSTGSFISTNNPSSPNDEHVSITIQGTHEQTMAAKEIIEQTIDESSTEMLVTSSLIGKIHGKGNRQLKQIARNSGAYVTVDYFSEEFYHVKISGSDAACTAAQENIENILFGDNFSPQLGTS